MECKTQLDKSQIPYELPMTSSSLKIDHILCAPLKPPKRQLASPDNLSISPALTNHIPREKTGLPCESSMPQQNMKKNVQNEYREAQKRVSFRLGTANVPRRSKSLRDWERASRRASCPALQMELQPKPSSATNEIIPGFCKPKRYSFLQTIPGIPRRALDSLDVSKASSSYVTYTTIKPLHERDEPCYSEKREPIKRALYSLSRTHNNVCVLRVGGGYMILSDYLEKYYANRSLYCIGRNGVNMDETSLRGSTVVHRLADGTMVLDDGSRILPSGIRVFENGLKLCPDGTWIDEDGNQITDHDRLKELNQKFGTGTSYPNTPDSKQRTKHAGQSSTSLESSSSSLSSTARSQEGNQVDGETSGSRPGISSASNRQARSRKSLTAQSDNKDAENDKTDRANPSGKQSNSNKKTTSLRRFSWNFNSEVINVLEDGTQVLADGTRIHKDGSITLADGTKLGIEEAQEFARRRKLGRWPKERQKRGNNNARNSSNDQGGSNTNSHSNSTHHSRTPSLEGIHGRKLGIGDAFRTDDATSDRSSSNSRLPLRIFGNGKAPMLCSQACTRQLSALDYLSRYCILTPDQIRHYKTVFSNLDRDRDGIISHASFRITLLNLSTLTLNILPHFAIQVELEFGIKTVNKHVITEREINYIDVVLELQRAKSINFRMFALICALSERVVGLTPLVRGLINTMDARALAHKIVGCRNLFYILDENHSGAVPVEELSNELIAGRISKEHENIIIDKFTEDGKDEVDFLDFLTYILLFVEIHDTINSNPFETVRDK